MRVAAIASGATPEWRSVRLGAMNDDPMRSAIRAMVQEVLELEDHEVRDDGDFHDDYDCDSVRKLDLIVALEKRFGILYLPPEAEAMRTIDDAVRMTAQHVGRP